MNRFDIILLDEAIDFLESLKEKERGKIIFNLNKARNTNDSKLFKKLTHLVWEFRTLYQGKQFRLFAFWDKRDKNNTLVISTHGIVKKTQKTPKKEIEKTEKVAKQFFIENK